MKVYLDNAATTKLDEHVLEAMLPYMREEYGNPSSIHAFGRKTRSAIEVARKTVSKLLNVAPSEIFFTSGGTFDRRQFLLIHEIPDCYRYYRHFLHLLQYLQCLN
jgi:cysteine sulfinate desulfinase/cysteine desulfurase-like protein